MRPAEQFPAIVLSTDDHQRLTNLAVASAEAVPEVSDYLAEELDRATVVAPDEVAAGVVTMNARVTFRDETTKQTRTVTLVYPHDADLAEGKVSVLTPIGAALIGVAEGHSICWYTRNGAAKTLTVLAVDRRMATADGDAA